MEIVPAIIAKDFKELESKIKLVEPYVCPEPGRGINWVQLDVMDGKFVPEITGYQPEDLKKIDTKLNLEAHLMIAEPEKEIDRWIESGAKRILVHIEPLISNVRAQNSNLQLKCQNLIEKCYAKSVEFGIVLNLETSISVLGKFQVSSFKFQVIQLMAIAKIGYHGQPFDERVIPKIRALRKMFLNVKIAVDGGIDLETAPRVIAAGADILAVGSAIFNSGNIEEAVKDFRNIKI